MPTDLQIKKKTKLFAMKHSFALRGCFFREPFPGSLTVAHVNRRSQKSCSVRATSTSEQRKKTNHNIMQPTLSI